MPNSRIIRINELLKREIAEDIHRIFANTDFDTAAITVTRVETAPNLRDAGVYISIFGHEETREEMIRFLNRHRKEVQARMSKHVIIKYTPRLHFKLDTSLETGDHILDILDILEHLDIPVGEAGNDE